MSDFKQTTSSDTTPVDDRDLAHPHRADQPTTPVLPAATSEPESGAFGLTVMDAAAQAGDIANMALDPEGDVGVGLVKLSDSEAAPGKLPELEPEAVDFADPKPTEGDVPDDGFGFVLNDNVERDAKPADEGDDGPKGEAVFGQG